MSPLPPGGGMPWMDALRARGRLLFRGGLMGAIASFALLVVAARLSDDAVGFESPLGYALWALTLLGVAAMLVGALVMPPQVGLPPPPGPEETPTEAFLRLAERAEGWLERTRRYLLLGGLFGAVAWLPLMAFGLLVTARGSGVLMMRVLSLAGLVAFLAVAILWWRRLREADEELRAWRLRIARLRRIEEDVLAEP